MRLYWTIPPKVPSPPRLSRRALLLSWQTAYDSTRLQNKRSYYLLLPERCAGDVPNVIDQNRLLTSSNCLLGTIVGNV